MTTKTAKRPATKQAEPDGKADEKFQAMKWAAEIYWPGLGGQVADQWAEWNEKLFDGQLEPAPMVLSPMTATLGHWFPLLDGNNAGKVPAVTSISRASLLRGMIQRLRSQGNEDNALSGHSLRWCELVVQTHKRLTGETIWASPEYEKVVPREQLGGGLYRPERRERTQDPCPETGQASLPRREIAAWPGSLLDLGHITIKTD